jgi:hypothetical protein
MSLKSRLSWFFYNAYWAIMTGIEDKNKRTLSIPVIELKIPGITQTP